MNLREAQREGLVACNTYLIRKCGVCHKPGHDKRTCPEMCKPIMPGKGWSWPPEMAR